MWCGVWARPQKPHAGVTRAGTRSGSQGLEAALESSALIYLNNVLVLPQCEFLALYFHLISSYAAGPVVIFLT